MSIEEARQVLRIEEEGLAAMRARLGQEFLQAVALLQTCPSRVIITGIGKSGIIGQKITATLNSTGTPACFLHPVEALHGDLGMVAGSDVILAISYSGETAELNGVVHILKKRGNAIIALTAGMHSTLARAATVVLDVKVPREACPLGLAPTASTTATLAMGDALSVVLLHRKNFQAQDFRENHPGGSLGERLRVQVKEVMLAGEAVPQILDTDDGVAAVRALNAKSLGAVVVVDQAGQVKGIVTDGDVRRMLGKTYDFLQQPIAQIMTADPISISADALAADALSVMQQHEITVLPIVSATGGLLGILHLHDLLGKGEFRFLL